VTTRAILRSSLYHMSLIHKL